LDTTFPRKEGVLVVPGTFNVCSAFDTLNIDLLPALSAPLTPKAKQSEQIFKKAMGERQLQDKREFKFKFLKVSYSQSEFDFDNYHFYTSQKGWTDDGLHLDFVARMWKFLRAKSLHHAVWVGRLIAPVKTAAPVIQPGFLTYDDETSILCCVWLAGKFGDVRVKETEVLEQVHDLPIWDDFWSITPHYIFSETMWRNGSIRLLPSDIHIKKNKKQGDMENLLESPSPSPPLSPSSQHGKKLKDSKAEKKTKKDKHSETVMQTPPKEGIVDLDESTDSEPSPGPQPKPPQGGSKRKASKAVVHTLGMKR